MRRARVPASRSECCEERACNDARDSAIFEDLTLHALGCARDLAIEEAARQRLDERAFVPTMPNRHVSLKNTSCHRPPITTHLALLPATMTNSPGIR
jgi:hypothetical protein